MCIVGAKVNEGQSKGDGLMFVLLFGDLFRVVSSASFHGVIETVAEVPDVRAI